MVPAITVVIVHRHRIAVTIVWRVRWRSCWANRPRGNASFPPKSNLIFVQFFTATSCSSPSRQLTATCNCPASTTHHPIVPANGWNWCNTMVSSKLQAAHSNSLFIDELLIKHYKHLYPSIYSTSCRKH
jgi:hypothetical protein